MLKIRDINLANPVVLAPMAGITDLPFRKIVRKYHSGLVCAEMVSAMALHYQSKRTREMLRVEPMEHPISIQLFGSEPEVMAEAAQVVTECGADIIDINMGCPVPKVAKNGEGAALMNNLPLAAVLIQAVVQSTHLPVTVKFRLGWSEQQIVCCELAKIAEDNGAAAVALHARTREQFYHGKADWNWIAEVKKAVKIPVIGNGDVDSPYSAKEMLEQTGCDGVMIGQGALGRPWVFRQVAEYLATGAFSPEPSLEERFKIIQQHFNWQLEFSGTERGVKEMRKYFAFYFKGLSGAARMRDLMNSLTSEEAVRKALKEYAMNLGVAL